MELEWEKLEAAAKGSLAHAYAPYSNFHVGAAVWCAGGAIFRGVNVENVSYGLTTCAERNAIAAAVAANHRKIEAVVVFTNATPPATPCGACRQVIAEFGPSALIRCVNNSGDQSEYTIQQLLPGAFSF